MQKNCPHGLQLFFNLEFEFPFTFLSNLNTPSREGPSVIKICLFSPFLHNNLFPWDLGGIGDIVAPFEDNNIFCPEVINIVKVSLLGLTMALQ